jgi:hypothetical protein
MKVGAMRRLALFFAAMFVANGVAASARACIEGLSAPRHETVQVADAGGQHHVCPDADDAAGDQTHCSQNHKNDDPKFSKDVPLADVCAAAPAVSRAWFDPVLVVESRASEPSIGPSLTILFGNLRL